MAKKSNQNRVFLWVGGFIPGGGRGEENLSFGEAEDEGKRRREAERAEAEVVASAAMGGRGDGGGRPAVGWR